jgi:hypothetical protein
MNATQARKMRAISVILSKVFYPAVKQGNQKLELSQAAIISVY